MRLASSETIVNFKFTLLWRCTTINDKEMWGFTHKSPRTKLATLQVYFVAGLTNLVLDSESSEELLSLLYVLLHNRETTVTFPNRLECILSTCACGAGLPQPIYVLCLPSSRRVSFLVCCFQILLYYQSMLLVNQTIMC